MGWGGGEGRIVNLTNFGVWGKGGFFFFLYRPFVGILGGGEGRGGGQGRVTFKTDYFWGFYRNSRYLFGHCKNRS